MKRRLLLALICLFHVAPLMAADVIGLSVPLMGRYTEISQRMEFGAQTAIERLKNSGRDVELVVVDDGCDDKAVIDTANKLLAAQAKVVVGPICFTIASRLAELVNSDDGSMPTVPVIAVNTRNKLLARKREIDELPLHELSNSPDAEALAVVEKLLPKFDGKPFAIIDDGSVYGRALSDGVRLLGEDAGLKPVVSVNFRPLQSNQIATLRRLRSSGVEAIFIAASAEDVVTIANDMAALEIDWPIGTGERGQLLPYVAANPDTLNKLIMVREKVIASPTDGSDEEKDPYVLLGRALVEIADQVVENEISDLSTLSFETSIGPIVFNKDGRASPAVYELLRWRGGGFIAHSGT